MTESAELVRLQRRIERERLARKHAERLLEEKARSLFASNQELLAFTRNLETQVDQRTEELKNALQQAELGARSQRQFLAMMSHEIRTPLHGILGLLDLLRMSEVNPIQTDYIETIRSTSLVLLRLLNDVLDLSKIDAGGFNLELEPFCLEDTVESLMKLHGPAADSKGLKLKFIDDLTCRVNLIGDESRLRQVVSNLINNAIKFTERGTIEVRIQSEQHLDEQTHAFKLTVKDTGIGISEDQMPRLFQEFSQADQYIHKRFGGTGLGLAIGRKLIESMGGELRVSSLPGIGSTFEISLQLKKHHKQPLVHSESDVFNPPDIPKDLKVLVVDDNPVNRVLLEGFLKRLGASPLLAFDGLDALEVIRKHGEIDLIFMDVIMPNMDGLEAAAQIRLLGGKKPIICGLSANAFKHDQQLCIQAGMNYFLSKPLSFKDLCTFINSIV